MPDTRPLAAADYNGDGNQDLAIGIRVATTLTVLSGNGAGGLAADKRLCITPGSPAP